jgi:hypothetical protein
VALEAHASERVLVWISLTEMDEVMASEGGSWVQNGKVVSDLDEEPVGGLDCRPGVWVWGKNIVGWGMKEAQ